MIITIKSNKDDGAKIGVEATTGKWYSAFKEINKGPNPALPFLRPGVTADFEVKDSPDGKYHNILSAKPATGQPAAPPSGQPAYQDRGGSTNASIEAQTAAKCLTELVVAGKATPEATTLLENWAKNKLRSSLQTNDGDIPF